MRAWWIVVFAACGGGSRTRISAGDAFTVEVSSPARDLAWRGVDSRVGGYAVGNCTLSYDQGMYQGGLQPDGDEADWQYRVTRIDGRPVRWARYTKAVEERTGPYWLALYVRGLTIDVTCPTAAERDAAVAWFETLRFGSYRGGDLLADREITGPATWSPAPPWCERTAGAPVGGTGDATLVVEAPAREAVATILAIPTGPGGQTMSQFFPEPAPTYTLSVLPGTYRVEVFSTQTEMVSCGEVDLQAGQVTTLRVLRFAL